MSREILDPSGLDPFAENSGFIPAWQNGWQLTRNPTEDFINSTWDRTRILYNARMFSDTPWLNFEGFPLFSFQDATPDPRQRLKEAFEEFLRRLGANKGKNPCADFFGGLKKVEDLLKPKNTKFTFGQTENPQAAAETKGKNVKINPTGIFMDTSGFVNIEINARRDFIRLTNVEAAAFIIAHEIGHRSGKLNNDGNDPLGVLSVLNNGIIQRNCFAEIKPVKGPPR